MKMVLLSCIVCILVLNITLACDYRIYADTNSSVSKNSKLDTMIIEFLSSVNRTAFVIKNNLNYNNGTLQVYIFLNNSTSSQFLSKDIQIQRIEGEMVQARLSSPEIINLSNADFVRQITIPSYPLIDKPNGKNLPVNEKSENSQFPFYYLLIPIFVGSIWIIIKFKKKVRGTKKNMESNHKS